MCGEIELNEGAAEDVFHGVGDEFGAVWDGVGVGVGEFPEGFGVTK